MEYILSHHQLVCSVFVHIRIKEVHNESMHRTKFYPILLKDLNLGNSSSHWSKHNVIEPFLILHDWCNVAVVHRFLINVVQFCSCQDGSTKEIQLSTSYKSMSCHMESQTWRAKQNGSEWHLLSFSPFLVFLCRALISCVPYRPQTVRDNKRLERKCLLPSGSAIPLGFGSEALCYRGTLLLPHSLPQCIVYSISCQLSAVSSPSKAPCSFYLWKQYLAILSSGYFN